MFKYIYLICKLFLRCCLPETITIDMVIDMLYYGYTCLCNNFDFTVDLNY